MGREALLRKLEDIFREVFGDDTIVLRDDTAPSDLDGWDSLMHITILTAIQDAFQLSFSLEEMLEMKSVREILAVLERKERER